jgi:hypothetical protein
MQYRTETLMDQKRNEAVVVVCYLRMNFEEKAEQAGHTPPSSFTFTHSLIHITMKNSHHEEQSREREKAMQSNGFHSKSKTKECFSLLGECRSRGGYESRVFVELFELEERKSNLSSIVSFSNC